MPDLLIPHPLMHLQRFRQEYLARVIAATVSYTNQELTDAFALERGNLERFIGQSSGYRHKAILRRHLVALCAMMEGWR